jgi:hypothetical protein
MSLLIQFGSHFRGIPHVPAVHQPEPRRNGGGKGNTVVDEIQWRRPRHVLPLGPRRAPLKPKTSLYPVSSVGHI